MGKTQNITQIELSMLHLLLNNQISLVLWFLFALVLCGSSISKSKDYVILNSGHKMPLRGFGTSNLKAKPFEVKEAVYQALQTGYRHLDCASLYQNEREVGQAIKEAMKDFNISRNELFITSKLWNTHHDPEDVEPAFRKSLKDLGLDYLDLYLIHWPVAFERGNLPFPHRPDGKIKLEGIHPSETWMAMEKLLKMPGAPVRSIGLANFNSAQVKDILDTGTVTPAVNQVECHAFFNQRKLKAFLDERNITLVAYSPLGNPRRPWAKPKDPVIVKDKLLRQIGAKFGGKTAAQIALKYSIQRGIPVIPMSIKASRIKENFDVMDFTLSPADMKLINDLSKNGTNARFYVRTNQKKELYGHSPHYPFHDEF